MKYCNQKVVSIAQTRKRAQTSRPQHYSGAQVRYINLPQIWDQIKGDNGSVSILTKSYWNIVTLRISWVLITGHAFILNA